MVRSRLSSGSRPVGRLLVVLGAPLVAGGRRIRDCGCVSPLLGAVVLGVVVLGAKVEFGVVVLGAVCSGAAFKLGSGVG